MFDTISYSKGASVLRMLESFMGEGEFILGVSNFLRRYAFQGAVTADLLAELAAVSAEGLDVEEVRRENQWLF